MRFFKSTLFATTLLSSSVISAHADINVVASIKPIHSLVAAVMEGVGEPEIIIEGAGSPHTYALKPSQARSLENADVVFWFGHELEAFLEKPLEAIAGDAKSVELLDAHDLIKLEFREGGAFEKHEHDDEHGDEHAEEKHDEHDHDEHKHDEHDHDEHAEKKHDDHDHDEHKHDEHDHDEHAEKKHDDHDHDEHKHDEHDHDEHAEKKHDDHDHDEHKHDEHGHDEHAHGEFDAHVWLDPINAKAIVHEIEETLIEADPDNAAKYEANAEALMAKLDGLVTEVTADLAPVKDKGFVVFHDAYQYFENRFGISAVGSITVSPEILPGAERISELKEKIKELNATCVFSEPQFESKLVTTVTEGTNAKSGILDPLGTGIESGPELYFTLIKNMSTSIQTCLSDS